jgi:hypothetical protein
MLQRFGARHDRNDRCGYAQRKAWATPAVAAGKGLLLHDTEPDGAAKYAAFLGVPGMKDAANAVWPACMMAHSGNARLNHHARRHALERE